MSESKLERLTVLGGGVLGGQIAWQSAFKDKIVTVYDPFPEALEKCKAAHADYAEIYRSELGATMEDIKGTRSRLTYTSDLAAAVAEADVVIEAVPESPEIKEKVYRQLAGLLPEHTLVATNSSTLLARDFSEATGRPDKFCALHFCVGIWSANLAEIMAHPGTSPETLQRIGAFAIEIGMVPIPVRKEQNGYILNTWLVALLSAAQHLVTEGIATPEDVDRTFMLTFRGARMGPMGLLDAIGMKTAYDISQYWGTVSNDPQMLANAAYFKENFLDKGLQGAQGGRGYYTYPKPTFADPEFLRVPDLSIVPEIVRLTRLDGKA